MLKKNYVVGDTVNFNLDKNPFHVGKGVITDFPNFGRAGITVCLLEDVKGGEFKKNQHIIIDKDEIV